MGNSKAAAARMKEKFGADYFERIGKKGGVKGTTGGFASKKRGKDGLTGKERARVVGVKGGKTSTREGVRSGKSRAKR